MLLSLLGGGHLGIGEVPDSCLQTGSDRHPRARAVFLQSPDAGLLLFGQGVCPSGVCVCVCFVFLQTRSMIVLNSDLNECVTLQLSYRMFKINSGVCVMNTH